MLSRHFPKLRFGLKSLLVLMLGIAIGFSLNLQIWKLLVGRSPSAALPLYVIEPPDILEINVTGGVSKNRKSISGKFLVGPDGRVNLNDAGSVYVAGLTIAQAAAAVEKAVAKALVSPTVAIDVFAYNSKKYYVITQPLGAAQAVSEFPFSGNETVLDAIAQVGGIAVPGPIEVSVVRPTPNGAGSENTLLVNWTELAGGNSEDTNYRLQPRDRVIVSQLAATPSTN